VSDVLADLGFDGSKDERLSVTLDRHESCRSPSQVSINAESALRNQIAKDGIQ